jgi:hypothetical protein
MAPIHPGLDHHHNPFYTRNHKSHHYDWTLIWVLVAVGALLLLELALTIAWLRIHNLRSKARWSRPREQGVVVVSGAAMVWMDDLPIKRGVSHVNLKEAVRKDEGRMGRERREEYERGGDGI